MTLSIRTRLTLWYSGVMAAALLVLSVGVLALHTFWGQRLVDADLAVLEAAATRVMQEEFGESGNLARAAAEFHEGLHVPEHAVAILDASGKPLAGDWDGFEFSRQVLGPDASPHLVTVSQGGRSWRVLTRPQPAGNGRFIVLVGETFDALDRQHRLLSRAAVIVTPLLVLLSGGVCWWVASAALKPVTHLAAQAEAMTGRSSDARLDVPPRTDELGQLASAFNRLLDRLAASSSAQRQFMADASHELRTPVSVIQTATEVTLARSERAPSEYREALTMINEQSARLRRVVEDMLALARADASGLHVARRPFCLDDVAADCAREFSILAAGRQIAIRTDLEPEVPVTGDAMLMRQLTTNLLANAVQYTPPGGVVTVAVSSDAATDTAVLSVSDTGPGIPIADRERVFERFVRLDPARSASSGAGLGLSIGRWIAEQHGGTLTIDAIPAGGCRAVLRLPLGVPAHA